MFIANNATHNLFVSDYNKQNSLLQTSMTRLSSGSRLIIPGEAPADLGISERFRAQIRNSEEAGRVIQNAINMFSTADSWLQQVHGMLDRMSELAIAASDASKNDGDRKNLDLEFQQLKQEIARISESGKYNGLQVNGNNSVAVYDYVKGTIVYTQTDGSEEKNIGLNLSEGNSASNGNGYLFVDSNDTAVGDFLFTPDGKDLIYVAQDSQGSVATAGQTLVKLNLSTDTVSFGDNLGTANTTAMNETTRFATDDKNRLWVSNYQGGNAYRVSLLDTQDMTLDHGGTTTSNEWAGTVATLTRGELAVHNDNIYYFDASNNYVRQNVFDQNDIQVILSDVSSTDSSTGGLAADDLLALSKDGLYLAWEDQSNYGVLNVMNTETQEKSTLVVGTTTAATQNGRISSIGFDSNNNVYWTDTGGTGNANALKRATVKFGDGPKITNVQTLRNTISGHVGQAAGNHIEGRGLSVGHGGPDSNLIFQVGPDKGMMVDYDTIDVELVDLGLSRLKVQSINEAQDAVGIIGKAIDEVSNQRAVMGAEVSRLHFTFAANDAYGNNIAQAESRIRDVDFASETAKMTSAQIAQQAAAAMVSQANASRQVVLSLLQ